MSRRGELDSQLDGWTTVRILSISSKHSPILNPDGGGDGAGNTEIDIDFKVISGRGDECLTCGARARSVVVLEVVRTQHGRSAAAVG